MEAQLFPRKTSVQDCAEKGSEEQICEYSNLPCFHEGICKFTLHQCEKQVE